MKYLIDDERDLLPNKEVPDVILRKPLNALALIEIGWMTKNDSLYLDHDMGDDSMDGHRLISRLEVLWVEDPKWADQKIPRNIFCVSDNAQGRHRIEQAITHIEKMRDEYEALNA